ncbi:unnamed protein product [Oikopleura dioica]|uniref:SRF-dependent transcription regulation-associated protein n=1 Tax=Oikopleura dioica TaxID=34765 RepID=E4X7E0_OIKDI|nr:unnamed protein product [Oikopleura dioica]
MSVEVEQLQKEQSENVAKQENDEEKKRGTNKMPPSSTNPNTLFKKGRISREEWIKLTRQKKKEAAEKWRKENGISKPEPRFNLNNEKIWFRNTYRQTKVHLVNNFVNKLKKYRYSREKLTSEVDLDSLSEEKKKNIKKKLSRCTNAEESLLKEMYLIKSWKANDVFEMLLKHEPVPFDDACQIAHDTGNLDLRARERIRQYKLVLPVWERLNKGLSFKKYLLLSNISIVFLLELKLFESSRSLESKSKAADLAKTVLEESKKETSKNSASSTKSVKTSEESTSKVSNKFSIKKLILWRQRVRNRQEISSLKSNTVQMEAKSTKTTCQRRFQMPMQRALTSTNSENSSQNEEEEEDEFKEYSSEDESEESEEEEEHVMEALKEDEPFEIEFTLPKSFQNKKSDDVKPEDTDIDVRTEDFDADSESSEDEGAENSDESDSDADGDEKETAATNGFFMTADHKPVKVAKTSKKDVKKFAKDNRDGQRERKRHAKAVYGQNLIEMEKQEQLKQKLAAKKDRKAEKRKIKEEKKNQPAELHGSWASAKRQKEQTVIQKFEGKKITFDDSD